MGKTFIENYSNNVKKPYLEYTLCSCLTDYAIDYVSENRSIISNIDKKIRDAVLVDFINYLGFRGGCSGCNEFGLYTEDLYDKRIMDKVAKLDTQYLLTTIQYFYAIYIFKYGMVESVLENSIMTNCTEKFDANDGAIVLVDFINYIAQVNNYDRRFTIKDLYEKFKIQEHKTEMNRLKAFIIKSSEYSKRLVVGEKIDDIFNDTAIKYNLSNILDDEKYIDNKLDEMYPWEKEEIEEEIYAMTYAYGKMVGNIKEQPQTEIINKKILEMKKR